MTILSLGVDGPIVGNNVCYVPRKSGCQVAQKVQGLCCIVFAAHPHKEHHPLSRMSNYLRPLFISNGIAEVNIHECNM